MQTRMFRAIIEREEARANLAEAMELFVESASPREIEHRLNTEFFITARERILCLDYASFRRRNSVGCSRLMGSKRSAGAAAIP